MIQVAGVVSVYAEVDFSELTDVHGARVDGIPTDGWGKLLIWDLAPLGNWSHPCLWVAVRPPEGVSILEAAQEDPDEEFTYTAIHGWPPMEPG